MSNEVVMTLDEEQEPLQEFVKNEETFEQIELNANVSEETISKVLNETKASVKESEETLSNPVD